MAYKPPPALTIGRTYQAIVMSEQSFEFSFSVSQSAKNRPSKPARRVLAWPFDAFSVSPDEMLVHVRAGQGTHRLRRNEVSILQRCEPMQTAEQHADAILRAEDSAHSRRPLVDIIDRLTDRGLLATESSVTKQFTKSDRPSQPAPISTLIIRSSGRPRAMKRALESILRHGASGIGISTCVVIDDSRDQAMRRKIGTLIEAAAERTEIRFVHLGPEHRDRLLALLAARGSLSRQRLDWFVNGQPGTGQRYGCAINLALLLAAGSRFALLDDDASLDAIFDEPSDASDVAELTDGHDVQPGFPEPGALSPPFREYPGFSPLRPHAEWLGTTTGEMLAGNGPAKVRLAGLTSRSLAEMRSDGRVRFTVNGVFGDPGTRSPRWIYCRPATQMTELMADEQRYRDLIGRRWMARRESRLRAMLGFTLMTTTLTGIDNTSIMLPTLPNGAGEDGVLGEAVRFLDPGSMQIGMPWMLRHQPETPRHWSDADLAKPVTVNPGMFFRQQLADLAETARSDDAGARAGLLRSRLTDLAAAGPCELSSEIFSQVMSERCEIAGLLGRRANEAKLPGYLVGDYRRMIEAQTRSKSMEDVVPAGVVTDIRNTAAAYAAGIDDWIGAWNIAREIGHNEIVDEILRS